MFRVIGAKKRCENSVSRPRQTNKKSTCWLNSTYCFLSKCVQKIHVHPKGIIKRLANIQTNCIQIRDTQQIHHSIKVIGLFKINVPQKNETSVSFSVY